MISFAKTGLMAATAAALLTAGAAPARAQARWEWDGGRQGEDPACASSSPSFAPPLAAAPS